MATRTVNREERTLRTVSPVVVGLLSLIPGLGQIVIGVWERGLIFLGSMVTLVGLMIWRVSVIAYRQTTWA